MTEAQLTRKIAEACKRRGAWVLKVHGGPNQPRGVPDLIICYRGRFIGLEVKRPGRQAYTTDYQERQLQAIETAGGYSAVVTSISDALQHLEQSGDNDEAI